MPTENFTVSIEVVPPQGSAAAKLLESLKSISHLPFNGFSVATNPVAKPRMSAMALCALIQQETGKPATLHCTTRDHNRLSLQSLLWGAKALKIKSVLITTGDFVALGDRVSTTTVRDVDVFDLIRMAREAGLHTGVALDHRVETGNIEKPVNRLKQKVEAGAGYVVTQPVYDKETALELADALGDIDIPVILGILPLRTFRHAEFLHNKVAGISIPAAVRDRMAAADDTVSEGAAMAREILEVARKNYSGACIMPPFDHYEVMEEILV